MDFMFQVSEVEEEFLRSQIVTLEKGRGKHRKYKSLVFTEQGVAMLSSVLKSEQAIQVNIEIMRTFSKLREILSSNKALAKKLSQLEAKYDHQFKSVFDAIREIMSNHSVPKKRVIGLSRKD